MNVFETATRQKLRIDTEVGRLSVEQLWDLPLQHTTKVNLDDVAKSIDAKLKESSQTSFVNNRTDSNPELRLAMDVVLYIISVKLQERDAAVAEKERQSKRDRLMALVAKKEDEALEGASLEELRKQIAELT